MNEENNDERPQDESEGESQDKAPSDSQEGSQGQAQESPADQPSDRPSDQSGAQSAEPSGGGGFDLGVIVDEARLILTNPVGFYRGMHKTGGLQRPLIFVIVMAAALAIVSTVVSFAGFGQFGAMAVGVGSLIVVPIAALIGSFIGAAIMYVIWKLMGSEEDYETAYRCIAYAGAIYPIMGLIGAVPYLGSIIGIAWGMYLMAIASMEVHGRTQQNSYGVFGILGAILILVNVNGERQTRQMRAQFEGIGETLGESFESLEDMSPEEAGQAIGEFLRGLEEGIDEDQQEDENE